MLEAVRECGSVVVQCDTTDSGCNGGSMEQAFSWIKSNGITSESEYPYKARTGSCNSAAKGKPVATVSGYSRVSSEGKL